MILDSVFSFTRIFHLFKKEFHEQKGNLIKFLIILSGILILLSFILGAIFHFTGNGTPEKHYDRFFFIYLVIIGSFFASMAFGDIHNRNKNQAYLMLPASTPEKFFLKIFSGIIIYPLIVFTIILVSGVLSEFIINKFLLDLNNSIFNPFRTKVLSTFILYLVIHSFFFQGSASFKKTSFIMSLLMVLGFHLIYTITFFITAVSLLDMETVSMFFAKAANASNGGNITSLPSLDQIFGIMGQTGVMLKVFIKYIFPGIFIPLNYIIAYLKQREIQVHHSA